MARDIATATMIPCPMYPPDLSYDGNMHLARKPHIAPPYAVTVSRATQKFVLGGNLKATPM